MITIYRNSWNANAAACVTVDADSVYARLMAAGHEVELLAGECPNANCGVEVETDAEKQAVDTFGSIDWAEKNSPT